MEIHIFLLANSNAFDLLLNSVGLPQQLPLAVVLRILEDASGELDAVDGILCEVESLELVGVEFLHHFLLELDELARAVVVFGLEHAVRNPHYGFQKLVLVGFVLPRLDPDRRLYEAVVVRGNALEH